MSSSLIWYTARASGLVVLALVSISVVLGLAMSTPLFPKRLRTAWLLDLHRYLAGLSIIFLAVHIGSILLDTYVSFGVEDVLIPLAGSWHPVAVAWGIVAFYLLLAVELTSLARARISLRLWRSLHFLSFPLFGFAMLHGLTAGSDRHTLSMRVACGVIIALVVGLSLLRGATALAARGSDRPSHRELRVPSR